MGKSHDGFKLSLIVITKELLNENSFRGGAGLINVALNLVSCVLNYYCNSMIFFMSICSTRVSGLITGSRCLREKLSTIF